MDGSGRGWRRTERPSSSSRPNLRYWCRYKRDGSLCRPYRASRHRSYRSARSEDRRRLVAMMPSALLPSTCQISFHCCPAATTPGISVTVYSLGPAGAGAARALVRRPAASGRRRSLARLQHLRFSCVLGACTPGPDRCPAGGGIWHKAVAAPSTPSTIVSIPVDFIKPSWFRVPEYQESAVV